MEERVSSSQTGGLPAGPNGRCGVMESLWEFIVASCWTPIEKSSSLEPPQFDGTEQAVDSSIEVVDDGTAAGSSGKRE